MKTTIAYEVFYFLKVFIFEDLLIWMPYIRKICNKQNLIYYMVYYALVLQFF